MTIEDVKKIAIEDYGIKEDELDIRLIDKNTVCFSRKNELQSFMALLREELVFPNP
jgi:hypothetical protein